MLKPENNIYTGNVNQRKREKIIAKAQKDNNFLFAYTVHFRKTIFLSFLNSPTVFQSQEIWLKNRLKTLNKVEKFEELKADKDDIPLQLNESKNIFGFSTLIREFYMQRITVIHKKTNLYSLHLNIEGGLFTIQTHANSIEEAHSNFLKTKNEFDEYLENPEIYHFLLENFDNYQAIIQNHSYIKVASMNEKKEFVKPRKRRKNEWRFSQRNCTIFIFPTFEGEVK
jgi:hypothetical protein